MATPDISNRKRDHLVVAASGNADFRNRTTLLEQVQLVHQALPDLALSDIQLETTLAGFRLSAPIIISGMTGGTEQAGQINRDLAQVAQRLGIGFGVGSQRAMADHPKLENTFQVRDVAPDVILIGNIGVVQAQEMGPNATRELARRIGANAMAVHLNPAMELIQGNGDRDFRGATQCIAALVEQCDIPIIVKETGCGLSPQVAAKLKSIGVQTVDVSGAGGTSWVGVEATRSAPGSPARQLGQELWDWGIPTAVSIAACKQHQLEVIATGGLRTGLDIARSLAPRCHLRRSRGADPTRAPTTRPGRSTTVCRTAHSFCPGRLTPLRHQPRPTVL